MHGRRASTRVRTRAGLCKQAGTRAGCTHTLALALPGMFVLLSGCRTAPAARNATAAGLETAPVAPTAAVAHVLVGDAQALRRICTPLGPRLGLLQVRTRAEWNCLAGIAPQVGACPDLQHGMLIGVACWAGSPADGHWPLRIDAIRAAAGKAWVEASFSGGSFLPDGLAFLETAYAGQVHAVSAVSVDGTTFYPSR